MKVGIVSLVDKDGMPYLKYYEDILKDNKIDYQSIFWDRFNEGEIEKDNNEYTIHMKCLPGEKKLKKIQSYRGNIPIFSNLTLTRLRAERRSLLILPTTLFGDCPCQALEQLNLALTTVSRAMWLAFIADDTILFLPISEFCTNR